MLIILSIIKNMTFSFKHENNRGTVEIKIIKITAAVGKEKR